MKVLDSMRVLLLATLAVFAQAAAKADDGTGAIFVSRRFGPFTKTTAGQCVPGETPNAVSGGAVSGADCTARIATRNDKATCDQGAGVGCKYIAATTVTDTDAIEAALVILTAVANAEAAQTSTSFYFQTPNSNTIDGFTVYKSEASLKAADALIKAVVGYTDLTAKGGDYTYDNASVTEATKTLLTGLTDRGQAGGWVSLKDGDVKADVAVGDKDTNTLSLWLTITTDATAEKCVKGSGFEGSELPATAGVCVGANEKGSCNITDDICKWVTQDEADAAVQAALDRMVAEVPKISKGTITYASWKDGHVWQLREIYATDDAFLHHLDSLGADRAAAATCTSNAGATDDVKQTDAQCTARGLTAALCDAEHAADADNVAKGTVCVFTYEKFAAKLGFGAAWFSGEFKTAIDLVSSSGGKWNVNKSGFAISNNGVKADFHADVDAVVFDVFDLPYVKARGNLLSVNAPKKEEVGTGNEKTGPAKTEAETEKVVKVTCTKGGADATDAPTDGWTKEKCENTGNTFKAGADATCKDAEAADVTVDKPDGGWTVATCTGANKFVEAGAATCTKDGADATGAPTDGWTKDACEKTGNAFSDGTTEPADASPAAALATFAAFITSMMML